MDSMDNTQSNISGKSVVSNMLWRLAERIGAQGVNFIVSVVLARILTPEDFGIVALTTTFTTILAVFMTSGLGISLIQKKDIDELDKSTALFANIGAGIILYAIVFFAAPYVASFYHQPRVTEVMRVLALTLVIGGLNSIQHALVSRAMKFKMFFRATLTGTLTSAVVGIWLAMKGFGVWAIVAQHLTNQAIDSIFLWFMIGWRPQLRFSWKRFKPLFGFGSRAYGAAMIETVYNSLRSLLIGRWYSGTDLAFYNRGRHIPALINLNTNQAIQSVMFPAYARAADDPVKLKQMMKRAMSIGAFIIFPSMMGLALVSESLINVLYTAKWQPAVPYLQIACFVYALNPMHVVNIQALLAVGRSDIRFRVEIIKKVIAVTVMVICVNISLMATAFSAVPLGIFALVINSWPVSKLLNYPLTEQLRDVSAAFLLSLAMGILVWLVGLLQIKNILRLILQVAVGVASYCLLAKLTKNKDYDYCRNYALGVIRKLGFGKQRGE